MLVLTGEKPYLKYFRCFKKQNREPFKNHKNTTEEKIRINFVFKGPYLEGRLGRLNGSKE